MSRVKCTSITIFVAITIFFGEVVFDHPINSLINDFFLIKINNNFEKTVFDDLVYNDGDTRIWMVTMYNTDGTVEEKKLAKVIDTATWNKCDFQDGRSLNFEDKNYYYRIESHDAGFNQDETLMICTQK